LFLVLLSIMTLAIRVLGLLLVGSDSAVVETHSAVKMYGVTKASLEAKCGEVSNDAKGFKKQLNASRVKIGLGNATEVKIANAICSPLNAGECDQHSECTWCSSASNGTCYALKDLSQPCHEEGIDLLIWGKDMASSAAGAAGTGAKAVRDKLVSAYNSCNQHNDVTACVGGAGSVCNWCSNTTSCHFKGSPTDKCLQNWLKNFAAKTGQPLTDAAQQTQNAMNAKLQDQIDFCNVTGTRDVCQDKVRCMWCSTAYNNAVNQCYFFGDTSNPCVSENIGKVVDAAGTVKDAALWATDKVGAKFQDMKKWGNNVCGKHTDNSTNCDEALQCQWCAKDTNCYIYGSINNPCGVGGALANAKSKVGDAWNSAKTWMWGSSACSSGKQQTQTALTGADVAAKKNIKMLCDEFAKAEAFADKSMLASSENTTSAGNAANSMITAIELRKAHFTLNETANAIKTQNDTATALSQFLKANPDCKSKTDSAVRSTSAVMLLITTMMAFDLFRLPLQWYNVRFQCQIS